jgi:hypothetical protein
MDRRPPSRKWLPVLCALVLTGCGDQAEKPAAGKARPARPNALAKRCSLGATAGDGGFPSGLLPDGAVVADQGYALVPGLLSDVYQALRKNAATGGLSIRDSELETLDAEIELESADGEFGLRLEPARDCPRATAVRLSG